MRSRGNLRRCSIDIGARLVRAALTNSTTITFDRAGTLFAASLRAGAVPILLTQDDGARGSDRVKGEGISLQLTTAQNIDELARRVRERGGTLESGPADVMGARMFESARAIVLASLPRDISNSDRKRMLYERFYAEPLSYEEIGIV